MDAKDFSDLSSFKARPSFIKNRSNRSDKVFWATFRFNFFKNPRRYIIFHKTHSRRKLLLFKIFKYFWLLFSLKQVANYPVITSSELVRRMYLKKGLFLIFFLNGNTN